MHQSSHGSSVETKKKEDKEANTVNAAASLDVVYYSKSNQIKGGRKGDLYRVNAVTEHKTVKGSKGFHYRVVWAEHEPTWEPESLLKENT